LRRRTFPLPIAWTAQAAFGVAGHDKGIGWWFSHHESLVSDQLRH
jgi:hypothetical protein